MLCYDIFDLADFPIIITNRNFVIEYKNTMATSFFAKFRKGSKITRHTLGLNENTDLSKLHEIDFTTGTQYKRALVFCQNNETVFFIFLSSSQFNKSELLINRINEEYGGNFWDFYISVYNEYVGTKNSFQKNTTDRLIGDLMLLLQFSDKKPSFTEQETYDFSELVTLISTRIGASIAALGFKMPAAKISEQAKKFCFCKINLKEFSFVIFKMIYVAFKNSTSRCVNLSLEYSDEGNAVLNVSTLTDQDIPSCENNFLSIISDISEFSLEITLLKKIRLFEDNISCKCENGVLTLTFKTKCINGSEALTLRSDPWNIRRRKTLRTISANTAKLKKLISKLL